MENPYRSPTTEPLLADDGRRPIGVTVLSVLTSILGIVLLAAFVISVVTWRGNNEFAVNQRMAPSIFWFFSSTSVVIAFVAAVGMWRGRKWGWWIACCGLVLFVFQNVANAAMVNLAFGTPSIATFASLESLKYVVRALFFAGVLTYWLSMRVRTYFNVEQTGRIKAICLSAACGIGITTIVTIVLQTIFLVSSR